MTILVQAVGAIACVAAACVLAAVNVIPGSDALGVVGVALGYFVHASGTVLSGPKGGGQ